MDKLTLRADYMGFWRHSVDDGIYNVGGGLLRAPTSDEKFVGHELDLSFKWAIDRHWRLHGGWAHFFTGEFLSATGSDAPIDFVWFDALVILMTIVVVLGWLVTYYAEQTGHHWHGGLSALWRTFYTLVVREFFVANFYARISQLILAAATRLNVLLRWS